MTDTGNTFWRDMLRAFRLTCGAEIAPKPRVMKIVINGGKLFDARELTDEIMKRLEAEGVVKRPWALPPLRLIVNEHAPADRPPVSDRRSHLRLIRGGRL